MALVAVLHKEQLGRLIAERRKELGLSQKALADLVHVKEGQTVSRWERGKNEPEDLSAVAQALKFSSVADMLKGIEQLPEKARRRLDPEGRTQLDRIEAKVDALLDHFKVVVSLDEIVSDFERETDAAAGSPAEPKPQRRDRRAA